MNQIDRETSLMELKKLHTKDVVILGITTTGLREIDELLSVAIIDFSGRVIINRIIKPTVSITKEAFNIHGIPNKNLKNAPSFLKIYSIIVDTIRNKTVCIYSADYGFRIFQQTSDKYKVINPLFYAEKLFCVMKTYSSIYGKWNYTKNNYQYCSLINAMKNESIIKYSQTQKQNALSDVFAIRDIIKSLIQ